MSHKQVLFRVANPYPQSVAQYVVIFSPFVASLGILVEATSYPAVKMGEVAIPFKGRKVFRPTVPEIDGLWKVRVSESVLQFAKTDLMAIDSAPFDVNARKVQIFPLTLGFMPLPGIQLNDVWLKGRDQVELDSSSMDVWKWNATFRYSSIEEKSLDTIANLRLAANWIRIHLPKKIPSSKLLNWTL